MYCRSMQFSQRSAARLLCWSPLSSVRSSPPWTHQLPLALIVRVYAVLLLAQAQLLHGIRQLRSAPALRPFCGIYTLIFLGTASVSAYSHLVLAIIRQEQQWLMLVWIGLGMVYAAFTYCPIVRIFSL